MKENRLLNTAAVAGLALGAISTAYMFLTQFISTLEIPVIVSTLVNAILWCAKFAGCIWLMMFYMKKVVRENPEATNGTTFRFGVLVSLLSALIFAAATFANIAYISTDLTAEQFNSAVEMYSKFLDSNSMSMIDSMMERMPQISFFSNLIYCTIYGTILSGILSRSIPSRDPFADNNR
ncbi:MAG: DUF4199 domain-containing protein [Candidatus Cryptobacteroides sp.]